MINQATRLQDAQDLTLDAAKPCHLVTHQVTLEKSREEQRRT
jgi:hypothetical protein